MSKYTVIVTRDATESTTVRDIEACCPRDAEAIALSLAGRYGQYLEDWQLDEGNFHETYVTDVSEQQRKK